MTKYEKLADQIEELEHKVDVELLRHGWEYSCSNPACIWLWEKKIGDGRVLAVDRSTAVMIQEQMGWKP